MDKSSIGSIQSPSPSDHGRPTKLQKLDPPISSSDSSLQAELECQRLKLEIKELHSRLAQNETAAISRHKFRNYMEQLLQKENNELKMQAQVDKVRIEHLLGELEASMRRNREAREAQVAAEAKLERLETTIMMELNPGALAASRYQENPFKIETTVKSGVEDIIKGQEKFDDSISIPVCSTYKIEIKEESFTIPEDYYSFETQGQCSEERGGLPVSADNPDNIRSVDLIQQQVSFLQESIKDSESSEKQFMECQDDRRSSWSCPGYRSREISRCSTATKQKVSHRQQKKKVSRQEQEKLSDDCPPLDPKWSLIFTEFSQWLVDQQDSDLGLSGSSDGDSCSESELLEEETLINSPLDPSAVVTSCLDNGKYRELSVGKSHCVLVPHEFFKTDWKRMYGQHNKGWACKKCPRLFTSEETVVDHVWASHYGGRYECPYCHTGARSFFKVRRSIRNHMLMKHPSLC